jgi:hypothetical protein
MERHINTKTYVENAETVVINESDKPSLPSSVTDNIESIDYRVGQLCEKILGKQSNVSFESSIADEVDGYIRAKEADGIKVFPSKKIYGRLNLEDDDWKKEFTVCYPIIEGIESESVLYKINSAINYEKVFDVSIGESIESDTYLSEFDYSIKLIRKPFIVFELHIDGVAAYPTHFLQHIVVNYQTGERLKIVDLFIENSLERLATVIDEFVQVDFIKANLKYKYHDEISLEISNESIHQLDTYYKHQFTKESFDEFFLDEDGITFIYHFEFPHILLPFEPEGYYFFFFASLSQFIKPNSILETFIKENTYQFD